MKKVMWTILILSLIELIIVGFRFEIIFIIVARTLSLFKLLGLDIRFGWIIGFEILTLAIYLLYAFLFRSTLLYGNITAIVMFAIVVIIIQLWDSYNYVYVEEDYYGEED